jgi:hypothetical protein
VRIHCIFNNLDSFAADFISASFCYLRQITGRAADLVPIESSLWQESSLHCSLESTVSCPSFRSQVLAANEIRCLCVTIGLCGQNPLQRVFGQKKIEVFFFGFSLAACSVQMPDYPVFGNLPVLWYGAASTRYHVIRTRGATVRLADSRSVWPAVQNFTQSHSE